MSEAFALKLRGSLFFSPALDPAAFHVCRTESDVLVWSCKPLALWQLEKTRSRSHFLKLLKSNGHGLTGIMAAPEQPCSLASSHGRQRFRSMIVTTAHAQSSLSFPFSVLDGMKQIFTP